VSDLLGSKGGSPFSHVTLWPSRASAFEKDLVGFMLMDHWGRANYLELVDVADSFQTAENATNHYGSMPRCFG